MHIMVESKDLISDFEKERGTSIPVAVMQETLQRALTKLEEICDASDDIALTRFCMQAAINKSLERGIHKAATGLYFEVMMTALEASPEWEQCMYAVDVVLAKESEELTLLTDTLNEACIVEVESLACIRRDVQGRAARGVKCALLDALVGRGVKLTAKMEKVCLWLDLQYKVVDELILEKANLLADAVISTPGIWVIKESDREGLVCAAMSYAGNISTNFSEAKISAFRSICSAARVIADIGDEMLLLSDELQVEFAPLIRRGRLHK